MHDKDHCSKIRIVLGPSHSDTEYHSAQATLECLPVHQSHLNFSIITSIFPLLFGNTFYSTNNDIKLYSLSLCSQVYSFPFLTPTHGTNSNQVWYVLGEGARGSRREGEDCYPQKS